MRRRGFLVLAVLVVAGCGVLPVQAKTISLAYRTGDTFKYSFHSATKQTLDAGGMTIPTDIDITAGESVMVKSVDSSGVADLTITLSNFVLKSVTGGITNTMTGLPDTTVDVTVAADGRLLNVGDSQYTASNPFLAFSGLGGGFFVTAVLPSNAVKPGDTWSKTYNQDNPDGTGGLKVVSHSTYLRDENVNGVNAAVVETKSVGTIDVSITMPNAVPSPAAASPSASPLGGATFSGMTIKGTENSDVTTWIDVSDHRVLKSHSTETNDGTMTLGITGTNPMPMLTGPMSSKGSATTDLNPA